jgi:soluble lytic murein transglycosylase
VSSKNADGKIGLMQISPDRLAFVYQTVLGEEIPNEGLLYDPRTNLRVGTAYLSYLYQKYGMWEPVFAAWRMGEAQTDLWLANPENLNGQGRLTRIPDSETQSYVNALLQASKLYASLYFEQTK